MAPSYDPFETKQLLSEKFFSPGLDFRDIRLDGLKWSTLYINNICISINTMKIQTSKALNTHTCARANTYIHIYCIKYVKIDDRHECNHRYLYV